MNRITFSDNFTLYDDASNHKKLKVMSKWEAMLDDERNDPVNDFSEEVEKFMEFGKTYEVTITFEEVNNA